MNDLASIISKNQQAWDESVASGNHNTVPFLNMDVNMLKQWANGEISWLDKPESKKVDNPFLLKIRKLVFSNLQGKKVLCLASGGGQQSALFSLLGADVTVVDISQGQLDSDVQAANHYGYTVKTILGSMTDLSALESDYFDVVYQPISICFVPDVSTVYREVYRVLKQGGLYEVHHINPATHPISYENKIDGWDGTGYRIASPYIGGPLRIDEQGNENMLCGEASGEHRHLFVDMFCNLTEAGFQIKYIWEDERNLLGETLERYRANLEEESYDGSFSVVQRYVHVLSVK